MRRHNRTRFAMREDRCHPTAVCAKCDGVSERSRHPRRSRTEPPLLTRNGETIALDGVDRSTPRAFVRLSARLAEPGHLELFDHGTPHPVTLTKISNAIRESSRNSFSFRAKQDPELPLARANSVNREVGVKPRVKRKLTTILAADVVEYSRLMEEDEEATLEILNSHSAIIEHRTAEYGGRIFGVSGDGLVAEFVSVVEALRCAVEIQKSLSECNSDLPKRQRMAFRIGLHLGDVMVQAGNLFGECVNIAARLERLAEPGGICASDLVRQSVTTRLGYFFEDAGLHQLKNISKPIRVWRFMLPTDGLPKGRVADQTFGRGRSDSALSPTSASLHGNTEEAEDVAVRVAKSFSKIYDPAARSAVLRMIRAIAQAESMGRAFDGG